MFVKVSRNDPLLVACDWLSIEPKPPGFAE
jgi:hypothetical protein